MQTKGEISVKQPLKKIICFTLIANTLISGCTLSKQTIKPTTSITMPSKQTIGFINYEELYKTVRNNNNISDYYKNKIYWFINSIPYIYQEFNYSVLNNNLRQAVINDKTVKDFTIPLGYKNDYLQGLEETKDYQLWNNLCHLLADSSKYQIEEEKCYGGSLYEGMANYLSSKYFNTKQYPILDNYIEALINIIGEERMLDIFLKGYSSDYILELYNIIPDNKKAKEVIKNIDNYLASTYLNKDIADKLYEYKYALLTKELEIDKIRDPKEDVYQMFEFDLILLKLSTDQASKTKQEYINEYQKKYNADLIAIYNYYNNQVDRKSDEEPLNHDQKRLLKG